MDISILVALAAILVAVAVLIGFLLATVLGGKSADFPPQAKREGLDRRISFYTDRRFQQMLLQLDERVVQSPHLLKEEERQWLLLLYHALGKWLGLQPVVAGEAAELNHVDQPPQVTSIPAPQVREVALQSEATRFAEFSDALTSPSADMPVKKGVADWLAQALQPKANAPEPPRSIAMQVDEILQRKLQERGWHGRGIRLLELPNKGMVVLIGLNQYATVDEVPDAEIRALIRASVSEWETKLLGG